MDCYIFADPHFQILVRTLICVLLINGLQSDGMQMVVVTLMQVLLMTCFEM